MSIRLYLLFAVLGASLGCEGTGFPRQLVSLRFVTPANCTPPSPLTQLRLEALGSFSPADSLVVAWTPPFSVSDLDRFPLATEYLSARAAAFGYEAVGTASLGAANGPQNDLPLVLAPLSAPCFLAPDFSFRDLPGSVLVATGTGGAVLAGGLRGVEEGSRRVLRLPPDLSLSEVLPSLAVGRIGASGTRSGDRIVIAGGAIFDDERALDTFLVLDAVSGEVVIPDRPLCPSNDPLCDGRRRDHGAVALSDGRVLVFGGVRRGGTALLTEEILNTAVLIDPTTGAVDVDIPTNLGAEVLPARRWPTLLALDHGERYVVGGQGSGGAHTGTVSRFDAAMQAFVEVRRRVALAEPSSRVLPFEEAVVVALPGARMAFFSGAGTVPVLAFDDGSDIVERYDVTVSWPDGLLTRPKAVALPDGSVFVTGRSPLGFRAYRVDLGRGTVQSLPAPVGEVLDLVHLGDGAVLELLSAGVSYRRVVLRTPFDHPLGLLLPTDSDWLSYDAAPDWMVTARGATATRAARVYLAGLVFDDFSLVIAADPGASLQLRLPGEGDLAAVVLGDGTVSVGLCDVPWDGTPVRLVRQGDSLILQSEQGSRSCRLPGLVGAVTLSVALAPGSGFRSLQLLRE